MGTMSPPLSLFDDNVETLCMAVIKIFHNNNSNNVITHSLFIRIAMTRQMTVTHIPSSAAMTF